MRTKPKVGVKIRLIRHFRELCVVNRECLLQHFSNHEGFNFFPASHDLLSALSSAFVRR